MDEDLADAEGVGDGDGVLATGAAESGEAMLRGVVAFGLSDRAYGPGHGLVGDGEETVRDLVEAHAPTRLRVDLVCEFLNDSLARLVV